MTRERALGWLGSMLLQSLALGALGVSPYMSYEDLPEPANAIPLRSYVPTIDAVEVPAATRAVPVNGRAKLDVARIFSEIAPVEPPDGILEETGLFQEGVEGVPIGLEIGAPGGPYGVSVAEGRELPPPPPQPVRVGGNIQAPRKRHHENPVYPSIAAAARLEGTVILEAQIDPNGNVVNVKVLRSIPLLDGAAIDAVKRWKYEPTLLNGAPVPILMTVTVRFELHG